MSLFVDGPARTALNADERLKRKMEKEIAQVCLRQLGNQRPATQVFFVPFSGLPERALAKPLVMRTNHIEESPNKKTLQNGHKYLQDGGILYQVRAGLVLQSLKNLYSQAGNRHKRHTTNPAHNKAPLRLTKFVVVLLGVLYILSA